MKTISKSSIYVFVGAIILALALPAASQQQVPFKGTIAGNDSDNFLSDTTVLVTSTGTGVSTQLGRFSFTLETTVDLVVGTETGTAEFTAANGDVIHTTYVGFGAFTNDPDVVGILETFTISGGTGRFAGAQGTFTMQRTGNVVTFRTVGLFEGTITSTGADH
ncbi:MAG TPA: hypothetical protein VLI45_05020 [Acidobacteriaceae bacterium]|nr:hypothetical protein [Acidobacteriaceae bacterium]